LFDAFSSREPVPTSLENALAIVIVAIGRVIPELLALDMLAIHAALIGMSGLVAIGEHHVFSDLVLCDVGIGAHPGALSMSARSGLLLASSAGHGFFLS
jgi:hypothetical protein